jgi:hypothetical protein
MNNTIQELQLIKRTAIMNANREPRGCTEEEAGRLVPFVVNTIVYAAVLDGAVYDFESALKKEHLYSDDVKKVVRMLKREAGICHNALYKNFDRIETGFGRLYNGRYDLTAEAIDRHILLQGGEKYYNIILGLLNLTIRNNARCKGGSSLLRDRLTPFIRRITNLGLPYEYKGEAIERIIESANKEVSKHKILTK